MTDEVQQSVVVVPAATPSAGQYPAVRHDGALPAEALPPSAGELPEFIERTRPGDELTEAANAAAQRCEQAAPMVADWALDFIDRGIAEPSVMHAADWVMAVFERGAPLRETIRRAHGYHFRAADLGLSSPDEPYLTSFLNHMARQGVSESDVGMFLAWYGDQMRSGGFRLHAEPSSHAARAAPTHGSEGLPTDPDEIAAEIMTVEAMMRVDRRAYMRDEGTQLRYRELLRARDAGRFQPD